MIPLHCGDGVGGDKASLLRGDNAGGGDSVI